MTKFFATHLVTTALVSALFVATTLPTAHASDTRDACALSLGTSSGTVVLTDTDPQFSGVRTDIGSLPIGGWASSEDDELAEFKEDRSRPSDENELDDFPQTPHEAIARELLKDNSYPGGSDIDHVLSLYDSIADVIEEIDRDPSLELASAREIELAFAARFVEKLGDQLSMTPEQREAILSAVQNFGLDASAVNRALDKEQIAQARLDAEHTESIRRIEEETQYEREHLENVAHLEEAIAEDIAALTAGLEVHEFGTNNDDAGFSSGEIDLGSFDLGDASFFGDIEFGSFDPGFGSFDIDFGASDFGDSLSFADLGGGWDMGWGGGGGGGGGKALHDELLLVGE